MNTCKDIARDFGITLLLALALMLAYFSQGCSSAPAPSARYGVSTASMVSLARLERATPMSFLETGLARDRWVPHCTAFAVTRLGRVQLATAAHCVKGTDQARYFRTWGLGLARVSWVSVARDVAYLDVEDASLVPLEMGIMQVGQSVRSYSTLYDAVSDGRVQYEYEGGWFETTQTIVFGWSGSPVVDSFGRVVGVVAKCNTTGGVCTPGHTQVASLL